MKSFAAVRRSRRLYLSAAVNMCTALSRPGKIGIVRVYRYNKMASIASSLSSFSSIILDSDS